MGLPALNGFIGEFTILLGAANRSLVWAAWAATGIVLGAAYLLWLYQRVFWGPLDNPANKVLLDVNKRELMTLIPLVALMVWIGIAPGIFFETIKEPVNYIVRQVEPEYFNAAPLSYTAASKPAAAATAKPAVATAAAAVVQPVAAQAEGAR